MFAIQFNNILEIWIASVFCVSILFYKRVGNSFSLNATFCFSMIFFMFNAVRISCWISLSTAGNCTKYFQSIGSIFFKSIIKTIIYYVEKNKIKWCNIGKVKYTKTYSSRCF